MSLLAEHRNKKREEKKTKQTTIFRTGNDPGSIQHLDMLDNDIDIQALIE